MKNKDSKARKRPYELGGYTVLPDVSKKKIETVSFCNFSSCGNLLDFILLH